MPYRLAESITDIAVYLAGKPKYIGMDTEGTGLNTRIAKLVGISIARAENDALYMPVGHKVGSNLPMDLVVQTLEAAGVGEDIEPVFFNAKYDLNILQANTKWYPKKYHEALEIIYLENPDRLQKNLKKTAKEDLDMDMERFEDIFTPEEVKAGILDISTKTPSRCTNYACADSDAGLRHFLKREKLRQEQHFAITVDTKLVDIVRRMEHNGGMKLNRAYIDQQMKRLEARAEAMKAQIHRMAGYVFEIESPKQLGVALFDKMGIPSPGRTKNGQHKTGAEDLEKLAPQYPVVDLVTTYRKIVKARSTYFAKLKKLDDLGIPVRFSFNMFGAPTFRFSAPGGDPLQDGFCGINIQAVSNGEAIDMQAVDLSATGGSDEYVRDLEGEDLLFQQDQGEVNLSEELELKQVDPASLPWVVEDESEKAKLMCFRETCGECPARCKTKGIDVTRRKQKNLKMVPSVRQAFMAPPGYVLLSFDYDRQELVIGANMSGEPEWLRALATGEDLHSVTAAAAFGIPLEQFKAMEHNPSTKEEWKRKRGIGKILNFATFYGATAYTLARKADIPQAQADKIYDGFKSKLRTLFTWIDKVHAFARKEKYTTTFFGRKRWLKDLYEKGESDPKMRAFADRSAVNTAIQGTAAEITRIAMVKVDAAFKRMGWKQSEIRFVMMIHDELMFLVREDMVKQVIPVIKEAMEFKVKSWQVQLTVAPKVGKIWGIQKEIKNLAEYLKAA